MLKVFSRYLCFSLLNISASYVLLVVFANYLEKSEYAKFGLYISIASILLVFINFGHKDAIFKFASKDSHTELNNTLSSSFLLFICSLPFIVLVGVSGNWTLAMGVFSILALHQVNIAAAFFRGSSLYHLDAVALPLYRIVWIVLVGFIYTFSDLLNTFLVFSAATLAAGGVWAAIGGARLIANNGVYFSSLIASFRNNSIKSFFLIELVTVAFMRFDMVSLSFFDATVENAANYFFGLQIYEAAILCVAPVGYLFFNEYNKAETVSSSKMLLTRYVLMLLGACVVGWAGWSLAGVWILNTFFPQYIEAYELVQLLLFGVLPNGVNAILSLYLFANHRESWYVWVSFSGVVVLLIFNSFLFSVWNIYGTATSRLLVEVLMTAVLCWIWVRHESYKHSS